MKLPNLHLATVEREKITDYLLNETHPITVGRLYSSLFSASREKIG